MNLPHTLQAWRGVAGGTSTKGQRGKFTQRHAAEFLGVPHKTYVDWEQGRRSPRGLSLSTILDRIQSSPLSAAKDCRPARRRKETKRKGHTAQQRRGGKRKKP